MPGANLYGWFGDPIGAGSWRKLVCNVDGKLIIDPSEILENPPTEDEAGKGATSEWCYDHKADPSAHHAKYTDLEARTACKLNGTLYWSCAGVHFDALEPDVDDILKYTDGYIKASVNNIYFVANINLPDGARVTGAEVFGDEAASAETWSIRRITLASGATDTMGGANIGTEDTSISYAVVNNSLYAYIFYTSSLDTDDTIYGARIAYTL